MTKSDLIEIIEKANYEDIKKAEIVYFTEDRNEIISQIIDAKKLGEKNDKRIC